MDRTDDLRSGLEGVIFDRTAISETRPGERKLTYRGYDVNELAGMCRFEEVAYLLWYGEIPNDGELATFCQAERAARPLSARQLVALELAPSHAHPMDVLRTAISSLSLDDGRGEAGSSDDSRMKALSLLAKVPTLVASHMRLREGKRVVHPDENLGFSENFFYMCFGKVPPPEYVRAFDGALTLYAEHGFNASTFTARVVVSSLADIYSGIVAAIGSLKGPLHGGANESVIRMLLEIGTPEQVGPWLDDTLQRKQRVSGFGHRVYRRGDSRVPMMTALRDSVATSNEGARLVDVADVLQREMHSRLGLHPNLDFPASPTYYMLGFPIDFFTPLFVMSRVVGWSAHIFEQLSANRLVRPSGLYTGNPPRELARTRSRTQAPNTTEAPRSGDGATTAPLSVSELREVTC